VTQKPIFVHYSNKFHSSQDLSWVRKNHFTIWDNYSCTAV